MNKSVAVEPTARAGFSQAAQDGVRQARADRFAESQAEAARLAAHDGRAGRNARIAADVAGVPAEADEEAEARDTSGRPRARRWSRSLGGSDASIRHEARNGIFTYLSTVNLPDAYCHVIGHSTAMQLKDVLARVESRLEVVGLSAHAASMAAKKPDAIRNLRRAVQNGERRGVTTETLAALAPVLKTSAAWLLEGVGANKAAPLRVVGRIGAGAEILPEYEQIPPEGLYEIDIALPLPAASIAFSVEGDSMWPRYNAGDLVICSESEHDPAAIAGREAAVRTGDGKRYLKTIRRGASVGRYDLESHNAPPIRSVAIAWAAPILLIIPQGRWYDLGGP